MIVLSNAPADRSVMWSDVSTFLLQFCPHDSDAMMLLQIAFLLQAKYNVAVDAASLLTFCQNQAEKCAAIEANRARFERKIRNLKTKR